MKKKTKIYPWKMYFHVLLGMFFLLPALLNAQNATVKVSGIVTDTNNEPLIGVSVAEKGTTNGAITDVDGKYSLTVRPTSTLRFSFISYKTQEVKVDGRKTINIRMEDDVQALKSLSDTERWIRKNSLLLYHTSPVRIFSISAVWTLP